MLYKKFLFMENYMKSLILPKNCIKFPNEQPYIDSFFSTQTYRKYNYDTCKYLFMWSTLADKYKNDKTYQKNFWKSLKTVINKEYKNLSFPSDFEDTLSVMNEIKTEFMENKKLYNKEHKELIKREKELDNAENGYATVDGELVEIGNRLIESSRIFIGRGDCSYRGCIVADVKGSDVTINTSDKNYKCYDNNGIKCNVEFKSDNMSVATYNEHIIGTDIIINKAIWFSNKSDMKTENDEHKYEKARLLQLHINEVTKTIKNMYMSEDEFERQIGCCAYIISVFGIRAGNTDTRDNGVVGASTLKVENIELYADKSSVHLDFLGKDSIRYSNTIKVDSDVLLPLWKCIDGKSCKDKVFDKITSIDVNRFLQSICNDIPDLSNKTFRTFWGCSLLVDELHKHEWKGLTPKQFKSLYDSCAREVTIKLNHKKTVSKEQKEKIDSSSKEKLDNAKKSYKELEKKIEEKLLKIKNDKLTAQFKGNKKKYKELCAKEKELKLKLENKKIKFSETKNDIKMKKENMDIALNTAKTNYSSPKVAFSLCKYAEQEPTTIYSKSLVERFSIWASDVDENYWKDYPNVKE